MAFNMADRWFRRAPVNRGFLPAHDHVRCHVRGIWHVRCFHARAVHLWLDVRLRTMRSGYDSQLLDDGKL